MKTVDVQTLATMTGLTARGVRKALVELKSGKRQTWQGTKPSVIEAHGQGGKSGIQYLVAVDSLPDHLKARWNALQGSVERDLIPVKNKPQKFEEDQWWFRLIKPLLDECLSRKERSQKIKALVARKDLTDWKGRPIQLSRTTVYTRLKKAGNAGFGSQARKARQDRGKKRYFISRLYDNSVPFDNETLAEIQHVIKQEVRGFLKKGTVHHLVRVLVRETLKKETQSRDFVLEDKEEFDRVCTIPHQFIHDEKSFRKVNRFRNDKKAHYDASPSIRRDWSKIQPMEIVVADIHHGNWLIAREDGTTATAKLIAFMDMATRRVWCDLIFFEGKGAVRNVDVIETLAAMWSDPAWGICGTLYIDNGNEYLFADYLDDAMQLALPVLPQGEEAGKSRIIRALPYNAKAKPIEAWFGSFENAYLMHLPGYIGDDRMKPKTDRIGKLPAPMKDFDRAVKKFFLLFDGYHNIPQACLGNLSPNQKFKQFVDNGWRAAVVDRAQLAATIGKRKTRVVHGDSVNLNKLQFSHMKLCRYAGETVVVVVPHYHGFSEVRVETMQGEFICNAQSQITYSPTDKRGAKVSADRKKQFNRAMIEMDSGTPDIDVSERIIDFAKAREKVKPNSSRAMVSAFADEPPAHTHKPVSQGRELPQSIEERDAEIKQRLEFEKQFFGKMRDKDNQS